MHITKYTKIVEKHGPEATQDARLIFLFYNLYKSPLFYNSTQVVFSSMLVFLVPASGVSFNLPR